MKKLNINRFSISPDEEFDMYIHYEEQYNQSGKCVSILVTANANMDIVRVEKNGLDVSSEWGGLPTVYAVKVYTSNVTETLTFFGSDGSQKTTTINVSSIETQFNDNTAIEANISINPNIKINNLSLGEIDTKVAALFDLIYPVGSIYYTNNANFNPNVSFNGTWEQIKDVFLLAAGDTYVGGTNGGAAAVQLTVNQLPKVSGSWSIHAQEGGTEWYGKSGYAIGTVYNGYRTLINQGTSGGATSLQNPGFAFGNNESHNNMPPYIVVYVWKRVS